MNSNDFENVVERQIDSCKNILLNKAKEYAMDNDRLHNFKNAAGMMGCDPKEALAGMMAKHTISIYDMCRDNEPHSMELWDEKITDHINYLLLLKAIVEEQSYASDSLEKVGNNLSEDFDKCENPKRYVTMPDGQPVFWNDNPVEIPAVKPDLAARILDFRDNIERCANADCECCPYFGAVLKGERCSKMFAHDFMTIIDDIIGEKEEK